jgi:hypothetical protein
MDIDEVCRALAAQTVTKMAQVENEAAESERAI